MQKDIFKKWFFQSSPNEVWEYLTKPELIEQWLMKSDFKPVVGHQFQFESSPDSDCKNPGNTYCTVLEVVPNKRLSYTWKAKNKLSDMNFDSTVTWTLSETKDGTELQLQHAGFTTQEDFDSHNNGWDNCMEKFGAMLIAN